MYEPDKLFHFVCGGGGGGGSKSQKSTTTTVNYHAASKRKKKSHAILTHADTPHRITRPPVQIGLDRP